MVRAFIVLAALLSTGLAYGQAKSEFGHSHYGAAFDSGMRTKPWKFEGIGNAPFPITTHSKEVQTWYDQGNALLHSFWFEEAERSFRWCLKLDRENPMIYFGLARCGLNVFSILAVDDPGLTRFRQFLKEAVKRKHTASERERLYIEAWDAAWAKSGDEAVKEMIARLQTLCQRFPDDIEAKCQLAFFSLGQGSALTNDLLLQQVLAVSPKHPGAHHARIHNWDNEDGARALNSCELYGKVAPGAGHALHMPGHIYSGLGMWHEAATAMDSATRVELRHMNERMALPFESWNYPHNRDYLSYIQEQLGRAEASLQGSRDILNAPTDPEILTSQYPAIMPFTRALLKFERWDEILDEKTWPSQLDPQWAVFKQAAQVIALAKTGQVAKARQAYKGIAAGLEFMIAPEIAKLPDQADKIRKDMEANMPSLFRIAEAKVLMAEGKHPEAMRMLQDLAAKERQARKDDTYANDPPVDPWPATRLIGDALLATGDTRVAISAYEETLQIVKNDAWSLASLAKAHASLGETEKATRYAGRFLAVWSGADPNLKWMREVRGLNLKATPKAETSKPERPYDPAKLARFGPSNWQPFAAPKLDCLDTSGKRVQLTDFRGKNVLVVFYLSDQCVHCMEQLNSINERLSEFESLNTVVLAVSAAKPEANRESVKLSPFKIKLLSDLDHSNARRFASYDDFEDMELHSTTLIDAKGRVRWKRTGGDPFQNIRFLLGEVKRWGTPK